ncbi:MAG: flagellar motor switch protein FliM [Thermotogaceae bacterium]|nr:flagellar motor switch protein FliM [Thermotogaceae bacterium]
MSDILSQDEIDKLLKSLSSGEVDMEEIKEEEEKKAVKTYDFKRPSKFSKEQLRTFEMIHENFARSLSTYLSGRVRSFVNISLASVDQITYEEFTRSLPNPSFVTVFSANELVGSVVMEMGLEIFYTILDLILGGPGLPMTNRSPTDVEISIMRREVLSILTHLAQAWEDIQAFVPNIESIESNPQFVQVAPPSEMVVLVTLYMSVGKTEGFMNICWPSNVIEPFAEKLSARLWFTTRAQKVSEENVKKLRESIKSAYADVSAVLGEVMLSLWDILNLNVGDVIRLNTHQDDPIIIKVNGTEKFKAMPGTYRGHYAAKISEMVKMEVKK